MNAGELLLRVEVRSEADVVMVHKRTRRATELLGFDKFEQARIATATSELVRNALLYARGGSCTGKALGCGDARPPRFAYEDDAAAARPDAGACASNADCETGRCALDEDPPADGRRGAYCESMTAGDAGAATRSD